MVIACSLLRTQVPFKLFANFIAYFQAPAQLPSAQCAQINCLLSGSQTLRHIQLAMCVCVCMCARALALFLFAAIN